MASTLVTTMSTDLFVPEVLADYIEQKYIDYVKFAPLAVIDNTLEGRPGDTLTMPFWKTNSVIPATADVAEGADIPIAKLEQDTTTATVGKFGVGVQYTDEAEINGWGNTAQEAVEQILAGIANELDNKFLAEMKNASLTATVTKAQGDVGGQIGDALIQFGEDIEGEKVLLVDPATYGLIRHSKDWIPNTEIGANMIIRGAVGMIHGCQIVVTNRLSGQNLAFIVKPGALRLVSKRGTLVETDRNIIDQTNYVTGTKICAPYLYNDSKIVKITIA